MEDAGPARRAAGSAAGPGLAGATLARLAVRALLTCSAGVMAAGFLNWRAGVLVAALTALSFILVSTVPASLRIPAPFGRGRLIRALRRHGYRVLPDGPSLHVAVGPGGVYLLDTRTWVHAVSRGPDDWRIGARPAAHAVRRVVERAARVEQAAEGAAGAVALRVVPVIMVAGRPPEPVMRAGQAIVARPRAAVGYIADRPRILAPARVDAVTTALARSLNGG